VTQPATIELPGGSHLESDAAALRRAQAIGFLRQAPINGIVQIAVAACMVLLLWDHVPQGWLLAWFAFLAIVSLDLLRRWYVGRNRPINRVSARTTHRAAIFATVAGLVWGSIALFLPMLPPLTQVAAFTLIVGMAGGAATTLAPMPVATSGFLIAALSPAVVRFALAPAPEHHVLALVSLIYLCGLLPSTRRVYRSFHESFVAERRNESLLREMGEVRAQWLRMSDNAEAFALLTADRRLVLWNAALARVFGMRPEDIHQGDRYLDAVARGEQTSASWLRAQQELFEYPDTPREQQLANGRWVRSVVRRTGDGGSLVAHVDITALKWRESELISARLSVERRTEELRLAFDQLEMQSRQIEEASHELATARDEALRANEAKSSFLANMSHELRTPLNAIIGFSEIMSGEMLGPMANAQYLDYTTDIGRSGRHLLTIVNDILDMSKIEARAMELREEETDLPQLLQECLRVLGPQIEAARIEVISSIDETMPLVFADSTRLRQVAFNLLSNAIKFTAPEGTLAVHAGLNDAGGVELAIRDSGIGMTHEEAELAIMPFRQVASVYSRDHQGTGLGLPLAKALVAMHGGTMEIASRKGEGTTVTVTLPATRLVPEPPRRAVG